MTEPSAMGYAPVNEMEISLRSRRSAAGSFRHPASERGRSSRLSAAAYRPSWRSGTATQAPTASKPRRQSLRQRGRAPPAVRVELGAAERTAGSERCDAFTTLGTVTGMHDPEGVASSSTQPKGRI